jgi:hypothetical protein
MYKKFLYLFLALALPGLIFLFLKKFGKNEFKVQTYFEEGLKPDSICNVSSIGPYQVPDSIISKIGFNRTKAIRVAITYPFVKDDLTEVGRIKSKYAMDSVEILIISGVPNNPKSEIPITFFDFNNFGNVVWCWLRVAEPFSVVVLDNENKIRGYYDGSKRDEMDRLDMELSILLKKY